MRAVDANHVAALLLMMVSRMTAVLPVWRSPMISSRWPRPIGIIASMALMPVCSGSRTGWRSTTPGAMRSSGLRCFGGDRALAVERLAQRIHHAADQRFAHGHGHDRVRALDGVAFLQFGRFAEQHRADLVFFQVQRDAEDVVREREHFAGHDLFQAVNARDAVADADDRADFVDRNGLLVVLDLLAQNLADFVCFDVRHACSCIFSNSAYSADRRRAPASRSSWLRNEPS